MTDVWLARRGRVDRSMDGRVRVLCGWHRGINYCAEPPIGWVRGLQPTHVMLPEGLTDEGSPGMFRWSSHARRRHASGQSMTHSRRSQGDDSPNWRGFYEAWRDAELPVTLPCRKGHSSRVDSDALSP